MSNYVYVYVHVLCTHTLVSAGSSGGANGTSHPKPAPGGATAGTGFPSDFKTKTQPSIAMSNTTRGQHYGYCIMLWST